MAVNRIHSGSGRAGGLLLYRHGLLALSPLPPGQKLDALRAADPKAPEERRPSRDP